MIKINQISRLKACVYFQDKKLFWPTEISTVLENSSNLKGHMFSAQKWMYHCTFQKVKFFKFTMVHPLLRWKHVTLLEEFSRTVKISVGQNNFLSWKYTHQAFNRLIWLIFIMSWQKKRPINDWASMKMLVSWTFWHAHPYFRISTSFWKLEVEEVGKEVVEIGPME